MDLNDVQFLEWIRDRLKNVHGENPNVDYMQRFESVIDKEKQNIAPPCFHYRVYKYEGGVGEVEIDEIHGEPYETAIITARIRYGSDAYIK